MLRVSCEDADVASQVLIDGQIKGECPLDVQVSAGVVKLRVQKPLNMERELAFEQKITMGDGVIKKIPVPLLRDSERSLATDQALARSGDPIAMKNLGYAYREGMSVPKNDTLSLAWYKKTAATFKKAADESADTKAMMGLGDLYFQGHGVEQSDRQGAAYYLKAADRGDAMAMMSLAALVARGKGFEKSSQQSAEWNKKAIDAAVKKANSGNAESMWEAGFIYQTGGVTSDQDYASKEAANWYRKAAEAGSPKGMTAFAGMLDLGIGVRQDTAQALMWLRKAAAAGDSYAIDKLRR